MTRVILRPEARADVLGAFDWYEQRRPGLGAEFREALDRAITRIAEVPLAHPLTYRDVRRALVSRFPYAVFYWVVEQDIVVIAVVHGRMHPRVARRRR